MTLLEKLMCAVGWHLKWSRQNFKFDQRDPHIVTEFVFAAGCQRCKTVFFKMHKVWDGDDFVDPTPACRDDIQ